MEGATERAAPGREQNEQIFRPALASVLGGLFLVAVATVGLSGQAEDHLLAGFAGLASIIYFAWLGLVFSFRHASPEERGEPYWRHRFTVLSAAAGIAWGLAGVLLYPGDSPIHQLLLALIVAGACASAVVTQALSRWSGAVFLLPAIIPLVVRTLLEADAIHVAGAAAMLAFLRALFTTQHYLHRSVLQRLAAERETQRLLADIRLGNERMAQAQRITKFGDWEWELKADRIRWSDEVFRIFDFEPGQLVTRSVLMYAIHPADRDGYEQALNAMLYGGLNLDMEYRIVRTDGEIRHLHDVAEVVTGPDGRPIRIKGVISDVSERVEAESKTVGAWRELNRILENMQDTYFRVDLSGGIHFVSRSVQTLLGHRADEVVLNRIEDFCARPADWAILVRTLNAAGGKVQNYELPLRRKDGSEARVAFNAQHVLGADGEVSAIEGTARDLSDLRQALAALDQEKERALVTLQSIGDGVVTTDEQGRVQYLNPVAERLLGYESAAAVGQHYLQLLAVVDEATGESLSDLVKFCLTGDTTVVHVDEGVFVHRDGTQYHLKITAAPIRGRGDHIIGAVLVLHDISDVMGMAQQLSYQASHDTLTGLYNRHFFEQRLEDAIRDVQSGGSSYVMLYMDLDQFKIVNDTCGHPAGDELLQQVAMLMQGSVREGDILARLGGDEFGVLLERCPLPKAIDIAEALRARIRDFRLAWRDKAFDVGVSIGVVPVDACSANLAEVLAAADAACYVAKDNGRNRIHVYQLEDDAVARRHGEMEWVHRLSAAFDEERFLLFAQPIVHLAGDPLVSHYEVLLRMTDPKGGLVPPMAFIPAAERYNLMPAIDRWVIRTAFTMMRDAQGELAFPPVNCAINISGQSLCDDNFLEFVVELFDATNIPPEAISFEITETAAIANLARATRFIRVMRDLGCSFALDDFGSGLSSFGYLKNLAVDYLKIDGSFVKNVANDRVDRAMVESINQIGHVLGLKTIAEFVDNGEAVAVLKSLGVDYAQGYGLGYPGPFSEVLEASLAQVGRLAAV